LDPDGLFGPIQFRTLVGAEALISGRAWETSLTNSFQISLNVRELKPGRDIRLIEKAPVTLDSLIGLEGLPLRTRVRKGRTDHTRRNGVLILLLLKHGRGWF
jgi:hypothetical protein